MHDQSIRLIIEFMQMEEFARAPLIIESGGSIRIRATDGTEFVDGISGVFAVSVGYGNANIIRAMRTQLGTLNFAPPLVSTNPTALAYADALVAVAPPGFSTVKLLSGGSEATEAAMKMARQYHRQTGHPHKFKIIAKYGSYHGATMGALSATGGPERKSMYEPLAPGFLHVHPPNCYQCPYQAVYPSCGLTCAAIIERTIEAEDPDTVAAVILDPISVPTEGFVVPPRDYFAAVRQICDRHDVLLIYDEVITGFGRLGEMFAADYYQVAPDILCCGKGMGGGYAALSGVLIQDRVYAAFRGAWADRREFQHGHTFGNHPLSAAAGLAVLREILERRLVENARVQGERMRRHLEDLARQYSCVGDVRGVGLLQGLEFADPTSHRPFPKSIAPGMRLSRALRRRGLLVRGATHCITLAPPLIVSASEVDEICTMVGDALSEVAAGLASESR